MMLACLVAVLLMTGQAAAEPLAIWTPFVQQTALYYASDTVTVAGAGIGTGVRLDCCQHITAQADASILWVNGNAVSTRFAAGYQRAGGWTPGIFGTFNLLWGQRTEVLSDTGARPASPVWVTGLRAAPLRFAGEGASVSALEFGIGFGPDRGRCYELTILSADFHW